MFRKHGKTAKRILTGLLTASLLSASFSAPLYASELREDIELTETVNDETLKAQEEAQETQERSQIRQGEAQVSGDTVDRSTEDAGNVDNSVHDGNISEEPAADPETDTILDGSENEVELTVEDAETLAVAAGFEELPEDEVLTHDQVQSKELLEEHLEEIDRSNDGVDYAENEIVVAADDYETALKYARAYNAVLLSYESGLALLELRPRYSLMKRLSTDMVEVAAVASANPAVNLPAAWPNYYDELFDAEYDYSEFDDYRCEYDDPMLRFYNVEEVVEEVEEEQVTKQVIKINDNYQWFHETLGSNAAWRAGYKGQGVKVAIIDSGISPHTDVECTQQCRVDDKGYVYDTAPEGYPHGTFVSLIIGAMAGNHLGGSGIAPECEMIMIKATNGDTKTITTYAEAVAVGRAGEIYDADIINMSLGGIHYTEYLESALDYAYKKGIFVVCASGNDGMNTATYPAMYKGAISVAASTRSNERAYLSNYGYAVRYGAPGLGVYVPKGTDYELCNGTSFSAPMISGMIAVILSSGKASGTGPKLVSNVLSMLDKSCTGANKGMGKGIPNLAVALGLDTNNATPSTPKADIGSGTYEDAELEVALSTVNSSALYKDMIFYSLDGRNVSFSNGVPSANAIKYDPTTKISITGKRSTTLKAIAVNPSNGLVSKQVSYTYTLKPVVADISVVSDTGQWKIQQGCSLGLKSTCIPSYSANTQVTFAVTDTPPGVTNKTSLYVSGSKLVAPANAVTGKYEITCTAKDKGHKQVPFNVYVEPNNKKVYSIGASKTSLTTYVGKSEEITITLKTIENRIKEDASAQSYSKWTSSNDAIATASIVDNTLTIAAHSAGSVTITGVANDGTKVSRSIKVTVRQHPESLTITPVIGDKLARGRSVKLACTVAPANTYNKGVKWSIEQIPGTADPKKTSASINSSNGTFSTSSKTTPGVYKVRATAKDKNVFDEIVYDEYEIEVCDTPTTSIKADKTSVTIFRKRNAYNCPTSASIKMTMNGGSYGSLSLTNSNPGLVKAELKPDGEVKVEATANGTGKAKLTVKTNDGTGKSATCTVSVVNPPSYLEITCPSGSSKNLVKGKSVKLIPNFGTVYGKLTSDSQKLVWSSQDPDIVSVNSKGVITAKVDNAPSVTITARTTDGSNLSSSIYIEPVANTKTIMTDGMWRRMVKKQGNTVIGYLGEYIDYLEVGKTGYMTIKNSGKEVGDNISPISKEYCDISVNKEGLSVNWISKSRELDGKPDSTISLYANKKGTYYVTIKMKDGSTASKKIKVVVK